MIVIVRRKVNKKILIIIKIHQDWFSYFVLLRLLNSFEVQVVHDVSLGLLFESLSTILFSSCSDFEGRIYQ